MVDGFRPRTLQEALKIRLQHDCLPIAGGTDLMVQKARGFGLKPGFEQPLLFIGHLEELQGIYVDDGKLRIGTGVLLSDLLKSAQVPKIFRDAVALMASPPSRNLASIGGNLCNASPAGDTLPFLYAVDAELVLKSFTTKRIVPIREFITGPKTTDLKTNELLTEIIISNKTFDVNYYKKVGQRKGMSLTKASFLGLANIEHDNVTDIRIAFGSVAPTIVRSRETEKKIIGESVKQALKILPEISSDYAKLIRPIDDARSSAAYRKRVSLNLLNTFLKSLALNN